MQFSGSACVGRRELTEKAAHTRDRLNGVFRSASVCVCLGRAKLLRMAGWI